jgi:hypothetical protein
MLLLLKSARRRIHSAVRWCRSLGHHLRVVLGPKTRLYETKSSSPLIVSLTSFPARIAGTWLAIESIFQQTYRPDKIILTLALEEFPGRKLPRAIRRQVARGLEIIWLETNRGSFDKLIPTRTAYPMATVLTVDDDKLLPKTLIAEIMDAHAMDPTAIVGARGWEMAAREGKIQYGLGWTRADVSTPSRKLFMPGNAGVLYPAGSLDDRVNDMHVAMELAPTADDIWFWGVATSKRTPMKCLGKAAYPTIFLQKNTPTLGNINRLNNGPQFQAVLDFFCIRNQVVTACVPDQ